MAIDLKFNDDRTGLEAIASTQVTKSDFMGACSEAFNNTNVVTQKYQILDFSQCTDFELSSDDINSLSQLAINASKINPNVIMAIVAPTDLVFGMSRVYEVYAEESGFKIKVFRNKSEAESWVESLLSS